MNATDGIEFFAEDSLQAIDATLGAAEHDRLFGLLAFEQTMQEQNTTLVISPDSDLLSPLFGAIRADGLGTVNVENMDVEKLRQMAPVSPGAPNLPEQPVAPPATDGSGADASDDAPEATN